jgi:hypothetical protein
MAWQHPQTVASLTQCCEAVAGFNCIPSRPRSRTRSVVRAVAGEFVSVVWLYHSTCREGCRRRLVAAAKPKEYHHACIVVSVPRPVLGIFVVVVLCDRDLHSGGARVS